MCVGEGSWGLLGRFCWFCLGCGRKFCDLILVGETFILERRESVSYFGEGRILESVSGRRGSVYLLL